MKHRKSRSSGSGTPRTTSKHLEAKAPTSLTTLMLITDAQSVLDPPTSQTRSRSPLSGLNWLLWLEFSWALLPPRNWGRFSVAKGVSRPSYEYIFDLGEVGGFPRLLQASSVRSRNRSRIFNLLPLHPTAGIMSKLGRWNLGPSVVL